MPLQWPLLHVRALYFVQCLAACCVSNFIVIFFKARGLDVHHIGLIIGGIYPFVQMVGGPCFCALADRTRMPKTIVLLSLLLGTVGTCCLLRVHGEWTPLLGRQLCRLPPPWLRRLAGSCYELPAPMLVQKGGPPFPPEL